MAVRVSFVSGARRWFGASRRRATNRQRARSAAGHRDARGGDDLAVSEDAEVVFGRWCREVEDGCDVLVDDGVWHGDGAAEKPELAVGADEADELDPAGGGPAVGEVAEGARRSWRGCGGAIGRGVSPRGPVAVVLVVERLEVACSLGE